MYVKYLIDLVDSRLIDDGSVNEKTMKEEKGEGGEKGKEKEKEKEFVPQA